MVTIIRSRRSDGHSLGGKRRRAGAGVGLFVAAGFAPVYPEHDLDHPAIDHVMAALDRVLDQHAPYPAVVMNRRWDVVRVNVGATRLFAGLCAPDPVPDPANVLRLMLDDDDTAMRWRDISAAVPAP